MKVEHRTFTIEKNGRKLAVELTTVSSIHHIELNPSEAGVRDVDVIQDLVKQMAESNPLGGKAKILVIHEVERLSKAAQHALRKTMELYIATCRMILVTTSTSKVIDAVRSRCLQIRVPAPSVGDVCDALKLMSGKENVKLPDAVAQDLAEKSNRNLRQASLALEVMYVQHGALAEGTKVKLPQWEVEVMDVAGSILKTQDPKTLLKARSKFYELLAHCIPAETILRRLLLELLPKLDTAIKGDVVYWAAFYEHRMQLGSKQIFHLEAFVSKVMLIIKKHVMALFM